MQKEEMQLDIQNKFSSFSDQILKISVPDFPNAKMEPRLQFPHPILPSVCCFYDFDCNMIPNLWVGVQVHRIAAFFFSIL
jgi:hypothetical protein